MRFARLRADNRGQSPIYARLDGDLATPLAGPPWSAGQAGVDSVGAAAPWAAHDLLCPVAPTKVVCVGRNYAAHAKELGNEAPVEPLLFLKPPSSLVGPGGEVVLPAASARVEHEAELGVVIGRRAKDVAPEHAIAHVLGYTCVCDVTARDLQRKDGQWTRAKGFDTFCPAGPWIETELDPANARVTCVVNGETRQAGTTASMIFDVATLIAYISRVMTLEPGDLIATGTPEGVGSLSRGDELRVEIGGIGALDVRVR
jgi:2-keto-4-pentenoate hydratase/2-oxohepta-3-ene-1,7-dioic acid hydratase in catechol pathway